MSIPYELNRKLEQEVNQIVAEGCHVLRTGNHVGIWCYCTEDQLAGYEDQINIILEPYRKQFSVYVQTERGYNASRGM